MISWHLGEDIMVVSHHFVQVLFDMLGWYHVILCAANDDELFLALSRSLLPFEPFASLPPDFVLVLQRTIDESAHKAGGMSLVVLVLPTFEGDRIGIRFIVSIYLFIHAQDTGKHLLELRLICAIASCLPQIFINTRHCP